MDAFLSSKAYLSLKALSFHPRLNSDGLLLGHKRGMRLFVEDIFPTCPGFFPTHEKFIELDQHFEDRILGFFSFRSDEKKRKKILAPFACGKLFLEVRLDRRDRIQLRSFIIDFEKEFFLSPILLRHSPR